MKSNFDTSAPLQGHSKKPMLKVIRAKCLDCCVQQPTEVRLCACKTCPLWPYRMGENPFHKRFMTDEQKTAATKQLRKKAPKNKTNKKTNSIYTGKQSVEDANGGEATGSKAAPSSASEHSSD